MQRKQWRSIHEFLSKAEPKRKWRSKEKDASMIQASHLETGLCPNSIENRFPTILRNKSSRRLFTFISPFPSFHTPRLACTLDSLVRVSRRVDKDRFSYGQKSHTISHDIKSCRRKLPPLPMLTINRTLDLQRNFRKNIEWKENDNSHNKVPQEWNPPANHPF